MHSVLHVTAAPEEVDKGAGASGTPAKPNTHGAWTWKLASSEHSVGTGSAAAVVARAVNASTAERSSARRGGLRERVIGILRGSPRPWHTRTIEYIGLQSKSARPQTGDVARCRPARPCVRWMTVRTLSLCGSHAEGETFMSTQEIKCPGCG